ncbi:hypothetical protein HF521_021303 [Silurus meridionalis]|uniref:RRM domain-containing protein n=1 Tax=Silurus meridionalis TaxID=175797 RepID=A0A8T0BB12_SILME|nr:hypothetical protein HF521_021303 [Silurus meridionalis]
MAPLPVVRYKTGTKGYGYVQFESPEAANLAKEKFNGKLLNGHKVSIQHFKSRKERETERNHHTQVFINKQKTLLRPEHQDNPVHAEDEECADSEYDSLHTKPEALPQVPAEEQSPAPPHVPAVEQSPALPQVPAVEQSPAPPHVPAVEQSPALPQVPAVEQSPAPPHVPAVEQSPAPPHFPAVEQSPAPPHVPDVQDVSMAAPPQKHLTIYMLESADFEMQIQMARDELLGGDRVLTGEELLEEDRVLTGDELLGGDRVLTGDELLGGDRVLTGDKLLGGDRVLTGDKLLGGD